MKDKTFGIPEADLQLALTKWHEAYREASEAQASAVDLVNSPAHYTKGGIETADYMKAKLTKEEWEGHCKACVIKYVSREKEKGGTQDLQKAEWYLKELIKSRGV